MREHPKFERLKIKISMINNSLYYDLKLQKYLMILNNLVYQA